MVDNGWKWLIYFHFSKTLKNVHFSKNWIFFTFQKLEIFSLFKNFSKTWNFFTFQKLEIFSLFKNLIFFSLFKNLNFFSLFKNLKFLSLFKNFTTFSLFKNLKFFHFSKTLKNVHFWLETLGLDNPWSGINPSVWWTPEWGKPRSL